MDWGTRLGSLQWQVDDVASLFNDLGADATMRKIESFYPGISATLFAKGFDAVKVLNAVNAFVGEIPEDAMKIDTSDKSDLKGKVTKTADKRVIRLSQAEKRNVDVGVSGPAMLWAFDSRVKDLVKRFECGITITEFSPEIEYWLNRPTFKLAPVQGPLTKEESEKANAPANA